MPGALGVQGDPIHVEREDAPRPADATLGRGGPVQPEPDLTEIERVERAGSVGRLERFPNGCCDGTVCVPYASQSAPQCGAAGAACFGFACNSARVNPSGSSASGW